ncbi:MAG: chemotaxis protein CheA, partial [Planctomycetota bacterium]
ICNSCFRALHTIKGAAGFLGLEPVIEFAHAAEDALNRLRKGEVAVSAKVMDLLLQSADVVRGQIEQLAAGTAPDAADPALIAALNAIGSEDAPTGTGTSVPVSDDDQTSENPEETSGGKPLDLGPQKMDLIEFMVTDLQDYAGQLGETIDQLRNDATRAEAAEQLGEIADNLVKTADFFELDDLTAVCQLMLDVAPKLNDLGPEPLAEAVVRLRAAEWILAQQAEGLAQSRVLSWPIATFVKRLSQAAEGADLSPDVAAKHGDDLDRLLQLDGILPPEVATPQTEAPKEPPADVAGKIEPAKPQPAKPKANKEPAAKAAAPSGGQQVEQTIRVEVGRLESLLNLVGQLVLNKNRVVALSRSVGEADIDHELNESFAEAAGDLDRLTSELQVGVMRTRMQPLAKLFDRYPRVIRDIARHTDKKINLEIVGKDTEVDKSVLELLADPLVHILRNSADHGIEPPEVRAESGKAEAGTITLTAEHQGSHVRVAIADDGKGLARSVIGGKAIEKGLVNRDTLDKMPDEEVFRFIFEAGFSTAAAVSDLSGRGVGMDVVRTNINKLNGQINIASAEGDGTTIEILIPLTVAIMPAMMVESDEDQYAIPLQSIVEIVRPEDTTISTIQGQRVVRLRDSVLPLIDLRDRLGQDRRPPEGRFAVVVRVGGQQVGLMVDRLIGQQEIVIKPLDDDYTQGGPFSGATIREDGRVCLILDVNELVKTAGHAPCPQRTAA